MNASIMYALCMYHDYVNTSELYPSCNILKERLQAIFIESKRAVLEDKGKYVAVTTLSCIY